MSIVFVCVVMGIDAENPSHYCTVGFSRDNDYGDRARLKVCNLLCPHVNIKYRVFFLGILLNFPEWINIVDSCLSFRHCIRDFSPFSEAFHPSLYRRSGKLNYHLPATCSLCPPSSQAQLRIPFYREHTISQLNLFGHTCRFDAFSPHTSGTAFHAIDDCASVS